MTKSDTGSELVFVYGTLRRGGSNAFRMDGAKFAGAATVEGKIYAITWYPGLVLESGPEKVVGELYGVGPDQMLALDEFEGISANEVEGAEYRRVKTVACTLNSSGEGIFEEAWAYEWKGPVEEKRRILSGDWLGSFVPRSFPWFTWIAAICLLCFPLGVLGVSVTGYYKSPLALLARHAMIVGSSLAPFAALYAAWLAMRRRERNVEKTQGCFLLALCACGVAALCLIGMLIEFIRGGS